MVEIEFKDVFKNGSVDTYKYLTALYAIELIKRVYPNHVDESSAYMYAIAHNELLHPDFIKGKNYYVAKRCRVIEEEVTFQVLEMVTKLIEPFKEDNSDSILASMDTIGLPGEVARVLLHEDLTDPNVMNTLELSVRNCHSDIYEGTLLPEGYSGLTKVRFSEVVKLFKPLLDSCKFTNISELRMKKDFNTKKLHDMGTWLSCLYRLFYPYTNDYWYVFEHEATIYPKAIDKAMNAPASTPEAVIGIVDNRNYSAPPCIKNRSGYLSVGERYLSCLYSVFIQKEYQSLIK